MPFRFILCKKYYVWEIYIIIYFVFYMYVVYNVCVLYGWICIWYVCMSMYVIWVVYVWMNIMFAWIFYIYIYICKYVIVCIIISFVYFRKG